MGTRWSTVAGMFGFVLLLQWLYPNLVHEPLHLLALKLQGLEGFISFDWGFPAHPSTTAVVMPGSVAGALLFQLLPSVVSVLLLSALVVTRTYATVWTHFVLPAYLGFDLIINIVTYESLYSDFRFLLAVSWAEVWLVSFVLILTGSVIWYSRRFLVEVLYEEDA